MKKGLKITLVVIGTAVLILGIMFAILIKNANRIIKYELESILGKDFSVKEIKLNWGEVEALDISFSNLSGKEVFKTDSLILKADFMGLIRKEYVVSNLSLKNPYILLETDNKGNLTNPFLQERAKGARKSIPPVVIKKIKIVNGSLDYIDRKVSRIPVLTRLKDIELESKEITFPLNDNFSTYIVTAKIPGSQSSGILKSKGKIKLKTGDMDCRAELTGLDITMFKPYFQKKGDVNVTKGILGVEMDMKITARKINAPGKAILKNLEFEAGHGTGKKFLSIPLYAIMKFLKNNNNQIMFNFVLEGNLDNPKFNIRESFLEKITLGLAEKLGLSVTRIGESIIVLGTEGVKQVGKGIKGIGEGLKDIFK